MIQKAEVASAPGRVHPILWRRPGPGERQGVRGRTPGGKGKAEREGEQAENEVGGAPPQVSDDGLGENRKQQADRAAAEHDGERETTPPVEPCRDSAGVPDVSSPVADQADEKEREIEVQQMRREQCERSIGSRENHNARQDDAARLIAVKQEAEAGVRQRPGSVQQC